MTRGPLLKCSDAWFYTRLSCIFINHARWTVGGHYDDGKWAISSYAIMRLCERAGANIHVRGLENLAGLEGPCVVVANHMSLAETCLLPCLMLPFTRMAFVVKESLLHYPFFGPILRSVKPISVKRENPRDDLKVVLSQGAETLADGRAVTIFPQATRNPVFEPRLFNSLGIKLAERSDVPVLPLALKTDFMGIGKRIKDFGPLTREREMFFEFGEPLKIDGNEKAVHKQVIAFISSRVQQWGGYVQGEA
ncbi:MAG: lysophospholipid acyltransferase family protein [Verrucomicrobia bacterium]|nr:lysophospholipid acyltransferase family protein [Verrucomicrobiota bacterium]